jgi:probable rRNA maturation factor
MNTILVHSSDGLDLPNSIKDSISFKCDKLISMECDDSISFQIAITILSDSEMKILNRSSRKKDYATDVLSFPTENFPGSPFLDLGTIYIAWGVCKNQASEIGNTVEDEFDRLLVHGFLHLLGYDHEISKEEEIRMMKKEDECLKGIES